MSFMLRDGQVSAMENEIKERNISMELYKKGMCRCVYKTGLSNEWYNKHLK